MCELYRSLSETYSWLVIFLVLLVFAMAAFILFKIYEDEY